MAAEHEGPERDGRGDLPAALPRPGADAGPRPHASTTSTLISDTIPSPTPSTDRSPSRHAAHRRAQQGLAGRAGCRDAARVRLPAAHRRPRAGAARPRQRRRVLLPAPARHRRLRRLRASSTSASPGATCCSTAAPPAEEVLPLGFGRSTFRFAARPGTGDERADFAGMRVATSYAGWCASTSPTTGVDAEVDPPRRRGGDRRPARRRRRHRRRRVDRHHPAPGRPGDRRGADPRVGGGAGAARRRGGEPARRPARAAHAGRDGRPPLRADGLRHPRRAGRARPSR